MREDERGAQHRNAVHRIRDTEHAAQNIICHRLGRLSRCRDCAAVEHDDAVGRQGREIEVVQDRDHGDAPTRTAADRFDEVELVFQVEARGRLVEKKQAGTVRGFAARELQEHAGRNARAAALRRRAS